MEDVSDSHVALSWGDPYGILLRRRHLLDRERVVEEAVAREVLAHVLLDELNTEIGVVHTLDLVADTRDCQGRSDRGIHLIIPHLTY